MTAAAQMCLDGPADLDLHVTGDAGRTVGVLAAASTLALD